MKKTALFLVLLLSATLIFAQPPAEQLITLKQCLQKAVEYSPRLKIQMMDQQKLQMQHKVNVGMGMPNVNISGSYDDYLNLPTQLIPGVIFGYPGQMIPVQFGTSFNISGSLDFSQMVYSQSYYSALRISRLMMDQGKLTGESTQTGLVFEVAQSYYYAQISRNQIRNLESNLEKLVKAENIARSQYANGLIMKVDVDRITVNKLNIQTQIDRLRVTYEQQLNLQRYYMGLDPATPIVFTDSITPATVNLQATVDPANHIDIRLLEKQKQLAMARIRLNQASWYPSLNLIGSVNYTNQSNDFYLAGNPGGWYNTTLVGLRLSVPVFNGLQRKYAVSQSKVDLDELKISEEDTRKSLDLQAKDASGRLLNAITDEERQRENIKVADRVFNISQEQYQKGIISLTDLLNAESGLSEAQTNHSLALVQMKIAELEFLRANGTLLEILK